MTTWEFIINNNKIRLYTEWQLYVADLIKFIDKKILDHLMRLADQGNQLAISFFSYMKSGEYEKIAELLHPYFVEILRDILIKHQEFITNREFDIFLFLQAFPRGEREYFAAYSPINSYKNKC